MTNTRTLLVLLDCEKAFDKVDQEQLLKALGRMRIEPKIINLVKAMYTKPT